MPTTGIGREQMYSIGFRDVLHAADPGSITRQEATRSGGAATAGHSESGLDLKVGECEAAES